MKLKHENWPELAKSWDAYGHQVKFAQCDEIKVRADDGKYVVVRYPVKRGFEVADLYREPDGSWEFCNDGSETLSDKQWKSLIIVPYCDEYTYNPDKEN